MKTKNRIQKYSFGRIVIDGQVYTADVIIYPDRVEASWWRKNGHLLVPEDLPFLEKEPPKILIIGQGKFGLMKISPEMIDHLKFLGVELRAAKSSGAVEIFNDIWKSGERNVVAALHLTC